MNHDQDKRDRLERALTCVYALGLAVVVFLALVGGIALFLRP
jgi:hypothetical protein